MRSHAIGAGAPRSPRGPRVALPWGRRTAFHRTLPGRTLLGSWLALLLAASAAPGQGVPGARGAPPGLPPRDTTVYGPFGTPGIPLQPFNMERDAPQSVIDLSFLHPGPAGKDGFVRVAGAHLVDGKGRRLRFWGFNLTEWSRGSWEVPSPEDAPRFADQLSRFGVNFVRLHFLDLPAPRGLIDGRRDDSQHFDSALAHEDYFIAQLIRRGIYVDLNLYVGRQFKPGDGVPAGRGGKEALFFDRRTIALERDYARQLLTHVNPYLGRRYTDEPGVAIVELVNEAAIGPGSGVTGEYDTELTGLYNAWLARHVSSEQLAQLRTLAGVAADQPVPRMTFREVQGAPQLGYFFENYPGTPSDRYHLEAAFFRELQGGFFEGMRAYLRDTLGVRVPILATADHAHAGSGYPVVQTTALLDVVDGHTYWQHPGEWNVKNAPMVDDPFNSTVVELSRSAVAGKPYTVSEVGHPFPNQYASEGIPILAAYAAFQDWDAAVWYTFERKRDPAWAPYVGDPFDVSLDPVKMPQIAAGALAFLRGDVAPARHTVTRSYTQRQVDDSRFLGRQERPYFTPAFPLQLPLQHAVRVGSFGGPPTATFQAGATDPYRSDTGQLAWYHGAPGTGLVTIDAPRTQALIGYVKAGGRAVSNLAADVRNDFCALVLSSLDGQPIARASRLLLTAAVRVENTDMAWDARRTHTAEQGRSPELIEPVVGTVILRGLEGARAVTAVALDGAGRPLGSPIAAQRLKIGWVLPVGDPVTTWYEVRVTR